MYSMGMGGRALLALASVLLLACSSCAPATTQARDGSVAIDAREQAPPDAGPKIDAGLLAFDAGPYAFSGGAPFALVPSASVVQVRAGGSVRVRFLILRQPDFDTSISVRASGLPREIRTHSTRARSQDQAVFVRIEVPFGGRRGDHAFTVSGSAAGFIRSHRIVLRVL